jgi:hypothetical protein
MDSWEKWKSSNNCVVPVMSELVRWSLEDHLGRKGSGRNEVQSPRRIRNRKRRNKGGWHPSPRRRCSPWPWAILPDSSTIDSGSDRLLLSIDQNVNRISHLPNNSGYCFLYRITRLQDSVGEITGEVHPLCHSTAHESAGRVGENHLVQGESQSV